MQQVVQTVLSGLAFNNGHLSNDGDPAKDSHATCTCRAYYHMFFISNWIDSDQIPRANSNCCSFKLCIMSESLNLPALASSGWFVQAEAPPGAVFLGIKAAIMRNGSGAQFVTIRRLVHSVVQSSILVDPCWIWKQTCQCARKSIGIGQAEPSSSFSGRWSLLNFPTHLLP